MFGLEMAASMIVTLLLVTMTVIGGFLFLMLKHRQDEEKTIPPLDLIDAKKLDDMVIRQVESSLHPILLNKGYAEEQIKEILTQRGQSFRR
jgi:hypothetical protein